MTTSTLHTAVCAFFAAIEHRDADAVGALLAPDGVVRDEGEGLELVGPAATADWVRSHLIEPRVRLEVTATTEADGVVLVESLAAVPGVAPLPFAYRFSGGVDGFTDIRITPAR